MRRCGWIVEEDSSSTGWATRLPDETRRREETAALESFIMMMALSLFGFYDES
jgi:hypothetical protein